MKLCTAVLAFLFLAVAVESQKPEILETENLKVAHHFAIAGGGHYASDCCYPKDSPQRRFPCRLMKSYYETDSGCPRPGVIFTTKKDKKICADPLREDVKSCMLSLKNT